MNGHVLVSWLLAFDPGHFVALCALAVCRQPFVQENLLFYTALFGVLLPRFFRMDLASRRNSFMLYRVTKVGCTASLSAPHAGTGPEAAMHIIRELATDLKSSYSHRACCRVVKLTCATGVSLYTQGFLARVTEQSVAIIELMTITNMTTVETQFYETRYYELHNLTNKF